MKDDTTNYAEATQISSPTKRESYNRLTAGEKIKYFKIRKMT